MDTLMRPVPMIQGKVRYSLSCIMLFTLFCFLMAMIFAGR